MAEDKEQVKAPAKKATETVFDELEPYRHDIASSNIQVLLLIGNPGSPVRHEVQLNNVAQEIKAKFS